MTLTINLQQLSSHLDSVNGDCEAFEAPCPFHTVGCPEKEVGLVKTYCFCLKSQNFPCKVLLNPLVTVKCK